MNFKEIFNEEGFYRTESFEDGFSFYINNKGELFSSQHISLFDSTPIKNKKIEISKELFNLYFEKLTDYWQTFPKAFKGSIYFYDSNKLFGEFVESGLFHNREELNSFVNSKGVVKGMKTIEAISYICFETKKQMIIKITKI